MVEGSKVTIYEVAAEAGVSISTVSKVLSSSHRVNETTREKVLDAVKRLNYIPSLAARGIASGRTSIIGLVIPFTPIQLLNDPHLQANICGIEEALNERDYALLTATASKEHEPSSSYERLLRSLYIEGAVVMETQEYKSRELHRQLSQQRYPWVVLGYPVGMVPCYCVHADDLQGAQSMTEYLINLGHRRIGVIHVERGAYGFEERLRGYHQMLNHYGIPFDENLVVHCSDWTSEEAYKIAPKILERSDRPSAIFALNDRMALGIIQWAREHGLRVPEDLSVVGFDDIPAAASNQLALTTIRQPSITMGHEAIKLLFNLLEGNTSSSRVVVGTELKVRASSGPPAME
ncbi:MAG TPA: LacI family DNA-binding transcriptional regulator [Chloroflexia bacterium]|nr:LacI family DNA-binding transcriptional regulator [Chloroflexia bacterium]